MNPEDETKAAETTAADVAAEDTAPESAQDAAENEEDYFAPVEVPLKKPRVKRKDLPPPSASAAT